MDPNLTTGIRVKKGWIIFTLLLSLLLLISLLFFIYNLNNKADNSQVVKPKLLKEINPSTQTGVFYVE